MSESTALPTEAQPPTNIQKFVYVECVYSWLGAKNQNAEFKLLLRPDGLRQHVQDGLCHVLDLLHRVHVGLHRRRHLVRAFWVGQEADVNQHPCDGPRLQQHRPLCCRPGTNTIKLTLQ